jgi:hypothetical protein
MDLNDREVVRPKRTKERTRRVAAGSGMNIYHTLIAPNAPFLYYLYMCTCINRSIARGRHTYRIQQITPWHLDKPRKRLRFSFLTTFVRTARKFTSTNIAIGTQVDKFSIWWEKDNQGTNVVWNGTRKLIALHL